MVLTDSGGMIKEAYYHGKQSIILDQQTEWVEIVENGWSNIAGPSRENILYYIENHIKPLVHPRLYFQPDAPKMISRIIFEYLEGNEKQTS
jgi:UDP-GlcNAc3NAcA epimerase